jgi:ABC-type Fe3+/spermidine/putrescine transport system ATPase subunit
VRAASPAPDGEAVLLAIRPERLRILPAGGPSENRLAGTVTLSAYAGDTLLHTVRLADGTEMRVSAPLGDGLAAARLPPETAVTLSWPPDACILLPA